MAILTLSDNSASTSVDPGTNPIVQAATANTQAQDNTGISVGQVAAAAASAVGAAPSITTFVTDPANKNVVLLGLLFLAWKYLR